MKNIYSKVGGKNKVTRERDKRGLKATIFILFYFFPASLWHNRQINIYLRCTV